MATLLERTKLALQTMVDNLRVVTDETILGDESINVLAPMILSAGAGSIPQEPERNYVRPEIYPEIPVVGVNTVFQLVRVTPYDISWCGFSCSFPINSNITVDWGDGSVVDYLNRSSVNYSHTYNFNTVTAPIAADGNKYVWSKLTMKDTPSYIKTIDFTSISQPSLVPQYGACPNAIEIIINCPLCTSINIYGDVYAIAVESINVIDSLVTSVLYSCHGMPFLLNIIWNKLQDADASFSSLPSLLELHLPNITTLTDSILNCNKLLVIYAPNITSMSSSVRNLYNILKLDFPNCTSTDNSCATCTNVTELNFPKLKSCTTGFSGFYSLLSATFPELISGGLLSNAINLLYLNTPKLEVLLTNGLLNANSLITHIAPELKQLTGLNLTNVYSVETLDYPKLTTVGNDCITLAYRLTTFNNIVTSFGNACLTSLYSILILDISHAVTIGASSVSLGYVLTDLKTDSLVTATSNNFNTMPNLRKPNMPLLKTSGIGLLSNNAITDFSGIKIEDVAITNCTIYNYTFTKQLPTNINIATTSFNLASNGASRESFVALFNRLTDRTGKPACNIYVSYSLPFTAAELLIATNKNYTISQL